MKATVGEGLSALQGKLGALCGKVTARGQTLTKKSVPGSVKPISMSSNQRVAQARYGAAVGAWRSASAEQRAAWDALGDEKGISGINYLVIIMSLDQSDVTLDDTEAATWDLPLSSLKSNMNRIRNQIIAVTGETWGTVSHSLASVWAKFDGTNGHKHTGAPGDGPLLPPSFVPSPDNSVRLAVESVFVGVVSSFGLRWTDLGRQGAETYVYSLAYLGNGVAVAGTYPNGKIFRTVM